MSLNSPSRNILVYIFNNFGLGKHGYEYVPTGPLAVFSPSRKTVVDYTSIFDMVADLGEQIGMRPKWYNLLVRGNNHQTSHASNYTGKLFGEHVWKVPFHRIFRMCC